MLHHLVCRYLRIATSKTTTCSQLHLLPQNPSSLIIAKRISSATASNPKDELSTVDYLVSACGLSPEAAHRASQRIVLKSTTNPDAVLSLLKTYGLTQPQITKLISNYPGLLFVKSDETLKPKLGFFQNLGISGPHLGNILSNNSNILKASLEKRIVPSINFLRTFVSRDDQIVRILKRLRWGLGTYDAERKLSPNIAILRNHGVPESNILIYPQILYTESNQFEKTVSQVKKMGFSLSSAMFLHGVHVLLAVKKPAWDAKLAVYKSFGWSEDEVLSVFKKQPSIMLSSVDKTKLALDFFMNTLKWTQGDFANNPTAILYDLEKRIIPRSDVLQILLSKDLIKKTSTGRALRVSEDVFLNKFVFKYQNELPDLLKTYQIKIGSEVDSTIAKL